MVGLRSDEQRHGFVSQLQLALFAWIKQNPAGRRIAARAVGDGRGAVAGAVERDDGLHRQHARADRSGARYGLGLVFATPSPRGLHTQIPGNAMTQFFGALDDPTQISAGNEMAKSRGGAMPELGGLSAGVFYASTAGRPWEKVRTPTSLTQHGPAPLTAEEIVERARRA